MRASFLEWVASLPMWAQFMVTLVLGGLLAVLTAGPLVYAMIRRRGG